MVSVKIFLNDLDKGGRKKPASLIRNLFLRQNILLPVIGSALIFKLDEFFLYQLAALFRSYLLG